ncbi:MAG: lipocalin family protein [Planctomycetes bacterium]|nr:lipocalin family protein [Planctomycetota bacterium]
MRRETGRCPWPSRAVGTAGLLVLAAAGCTGIPSGLEAVGGFDAERYLGRWYEIARFDHRFERGLTHVTADYTRLPDGDIEVLNRGYDPASGEWREAKGIARLRGEPDAASLKVSFFRPFWAGYHVIALDRDGYRYAMVTSGSRSYLWILARTPALDPPIVADLIARAKAWGFATDDLIFVKQEPADPSKQPPPDGAGRPPRALRSTSP